MVHLGKYQPLFKWRDLCGEFPQIGDFRAPKRWYFVDLPGGSGSIIVWLRTNRPRSFPGERRDWDPFITWEWSISGGTDLTYMRATMEWFTAARKLGLTFRAEWAGGGVATMSFEWSPMRGTYVAWEPSMSGWTTSSSDATKWNWGASSEPAIRLGRAPWPDEPDP